MLPQPTTLWAKQLVLQEKLNLPKVVCTRLQSRLKESDAVPALARLAQLLSLQGKLKARIILSLTHPTKNIGTEDPLSPNSFILHLQTIKSTCNQCFILFQTKI